MRMNLVVKSSGMAASTERRNFRRVVISLSLIALAALARAARADEGVDADTDLAQRGAWLVGLRFEPAPSVASAE